VVHVVSPDRKTDSTLQDRQRTYNVALRRVPAATVTVEKH